MIEEAGTSSKSQELCRNANLIYMEVSLVTFLNHLIRKLLGNQIEFRHVHDLNQIRNIKNLHMGNLLR